MALLTLYQRSVILGLLLSDGCLIKRNPGGGAYFSLTQTLNPNNINILGHVVLLFFVFNLLQDFIATSVQNWAITKGLLFPYLFFNTVITAEFTNLFNLWYPEGTKIVPASITSELDPVALAGRMGDGGKCGAGFHLNTNAFGPQSIINRYLIFKFWPNL